MSSRWISRCRIWTAWKCCGAFALSACNFRVIMFSTLTSGRGKNAGGLDPRADDYVAKVSNEGSRRDRSMIRLREEMIPKIMQFFRLPELSFRLSQAATPRQHHRRIRRFAQRRFFKREDQSQGGGNRKSRREGQLRAGNKFLTKLPAGLQSSLPFSAHVAHSNIHTSAAFCSHHRTRIIDHIRCACGASEQHLQYSASKRRHRAANVDRARS